MNQPGGLTIRWRLTLWFTITLTLIIAVFAVLFLWLLKASLSNELDKQLREDFRQAQRNLSVRDNGSLYWISEETPIDDTGLNEYWIRVTTGAGKVLLKEPNGWKPAQKHLRYFSGEVRIGDSVVQVKVGRTENQMRHALRQFALMLALLIPLGVALAALAGYLMTSKALAPLRQLTGRAREISPEQMDARLPVENPKDEIGQLAQVFNQALERLELSFSQMQRFTSNASHELRTPLTCLRTTGELALREAKTAAECREAIGSMLEEADRLTRLINSLLALARAEAGEVRPAFEPVELSALARALIDQVGVLAEEKGQKLASDTPREVWVWADAGLLRQAVVNLLDNAIKYSPPDSEIRLRVFDREHFAVLEVTDSGPGIPEAHRGRIFERFYRIDDARSRSAGGTGLGLAICQWIVGAHHGKIEVTCGTERGSTFSIVLDLLDAGNRSRFMQEKSKSTRNPSLAIKAPEPNPPVA